MFYIILIAIVALIIYGTVASGSQKINPSEDSEFSLTRPFSQSAVDYSNSIPDDVMKSINNSCQSFIEKINSEITDVSTHKNISHCDFKIFTQKCGVYYDFWSEGQHYCPYIVNFKQLGYGEVYSQDKLDGIVYASLRIIHNTCLSTNTAIDYYKIFVLQTDTKDKYSKAFCLRVFIKKPPEAELKKL